jgi:hypothetical protein
VGAQRIASLLGINHQLTMLSVPRAGVIWYKDDQAVIDTADN